MTIRHLALSLLFATAAAAQPLPTKVLVRAVSRDAKIIGSHVGGARITIRDAATRKVLASGIQEGGTGDTKKIMTEPRPRGGTVYATDGAAGWTGTLMLDQPTRVEITAEGPLKYPQSIQKVSKTLTLLPGQDIAGEGVLLEIHGFNIDLLAPAASRVAPGEVPVRIKMTMTCGCPIEPGGIWDANAITTTVRLLQGGKSVGDARLAYAGETSMFSATLKDVPAGVYDLEITASEPKSANFAVYRQHLTVR